MSLRLSPCNPTSYRMEYSSSSSAIWPGQGSSLRGDPFSRRPKSPESTSIWFQTNKHLIPQSFVHLHLDVNWCCIVWQFPTKGFVRSVQYWLVETFRLSHPHDVFVHGWENVRWELVYKKASTPDHWLFSEIRLEAPQYIWLILVICGQDQNLKLALMAMRINFLSLAFTKQFAKYLRIFGRSQIFPNVWSTSAHFFFRRPHHTQENHMPSQNLICAEGILHFQKHEMKKKMDIYNRTWYATILRWSHPNNIDWTTIRFWKDDSHLIWV